MKLLPIDVDWKSIFHSFLKQKTCQNIYVYTGKVCGRAFAVALTEKERIACELPAKKAVRIYGTEEDDRTLWKKYQAVANDPEWKICEKLLLQ